jgi:hypothetical protein
MFPGIDLLLALGLGVLTIVMYLLPNKTPPTMIILLAIAFGLSFYIVWTFPWLKESLGRRLAGLLFVAACLCMFGDYVWPRLEQPKQPTAEEIAAEIIKQIPSLPRQLQATPAGEALREPPDITKAKKRALIASAEQFEYKTGLNDVSREVPGYFALSTSPSARGYSISTVTTKDSFGTHYYASVRLAGLKGAWTLELGGEGIWFGVDPAWRGYFIWESEENWTTWRSLQVERQPDINTLSFEQKGRKIYAFVNNNYITTFTKLREAQPGPIGVRIKADPAGGQITFQKLSIWELP